VIKLYPKRERDFTKSIARKKDIGIGNISDIALFLLFFIILIGVRLSPLGTTATTGLLYQPQMIDDGDCGDSTCLRPLGYRDRLDVDGRILLK
jgi:hypothetical protein